MKTFTICIIIAFFSLIGTIFVMETHAFLVSSLSISMITAVCSFIGTIFIMETHAVSINTGVITMKTPSISIKTGVINVKTVSFSVKEVSAMVILAIVGTILAIVIVENLGVLE